MPVGSKMYKGAGPLVKQAQLRRRCSAPHRFLRAFLAATAGIAGFVLGTSGTQDAVANGDTRTLTMFHTHTKESATITFRRNGTYDAAALKQLNWFLRDWRTNEPTQMDPQVFDVVWAVYREVGADVPINIISAYRSPKTNGMLHRRSNGVAEQSQHMLGKAIDISLPGVDMGRVRAAAMRLQDGGVGFYGSSGFVHLDVAGVRAWPRMTRGQLASLFPDGKTVHLPPDGKPLARYEEAKAEILARRGTISGGAFGVAEEDGPTGRRSFWATLFGRNDDAGLGVSRVSSFAGDTRRTGDRLVKSGSSGKQAKSLAPLPPTEPIGSREARPNPASDDVVVLRELFASALVSGTASHPRPLRVAMSSAKPQPLADDSLVPDPGPPLNMRLSWSPSGDLSSSSFAGPAVKPLPILAALAP